jgi:hypothetical protein
MLKLLALAALGVFAYAQIALIRSALPGAARRRSTPTRGRP